MDKAEYNARAAKLSIRAQKTLALIERGRYYPLSAGNRLPKSIDELIEAGLIDAVGRVIVVQTCYVPAFGYVPYQEEQFNQSEN